MSSQIDGDYPIRKLLIVGGGSAGWMAAAYLSRALGKSVTIELVESDDIGIVGVGEATIPPIRDFNRVAGVDEAALLAATDATFKIGIQFENWGQQGDTYLHAFGHTGRELDALVPLHHWWLHGRTGEETGYPSWEEMFLGRTAADDKRFGIDQRPGADLSRLLPHAFHFDALAYSQYLRELAQGRGVARTEGRIAQAVRDGEAGSVSHVELDDGRHIDADFFIDCSGFQSLLVGRTMEQPFDDWSAYLPSDRAVVVQTEPTGTAIAPYTRAIAHETGWQWQIPLQSRVGNGHVYSSAYSTDEAAQQRLMKNLPGEPTNDPRLLRFRTGRYREPWAGNVLALGLAAGFLEPLESTSIHLVQAGLERFVSLFPATRDGSQERSRFNRQSEVEWLQVRDFIIAHYAVTQRNDSEFWRHCSAMSLPDSLSETLDIWKAHGSLAIDGGHLFQLSSWTSLLIGQNLLPNQPHPLTSRVDARVIRQQIVKISHALRTHGSSLPDHREFINRVLASAPKS